MPDHIHILIPLKYSNSDDDRIFEGKERNTDTPGDSEGNEGIYEQEFLDKNFWTRGYCVSTVGLNEEQIRNYIKNQERLDNGQQGLLNLDGNKPPYKGASKPLVMSVINDS